MEKVKLLNVNFDNFSMQEALETINDGVVYTPNVDHLVKLQRDLEFFTAYGEADYRLCDSKIIFWISRFMGSPIKEKVSGSDFFPKFCDYHKSNEAIKIFLLGAKEGVAAQAQENLNEKAGRELVIGAHSPSFGFEKNEEECDRIINMVNQSGATVLAVGVGAPKQELWIQKYRHRFKTIKIFLAIGATIDFEAGNVDRSPKWMSEAGLEWLHRLQKQPVRMFKRYIVEDLWFFIYILQQKLGLYKNPFSSEL